MKKTLSKTLHYFLIALLFIGTFSCSPEEEMIRDTETEETDSSEANNENETEDSESNDETDNNDEMDNDSEEEDNEETPDDPVVSVPSGAVTTYGKLQVNGNKIYSENTNEVIQLRGMSLFWSQWQEGTLFYHEDVIKWLVEDWNVNIVRAAIGVDAADGGYVSSTAVAQSETEKAFAVIDAAIENDIYVIVDWHSHYAHLNDPGSYSYAKQFFTDVYERYGNIPNIIYEPFNEPKYNYIGAPDGSDFATWDDIKPYHTAIVNMLRNLGAENLIVCGTGIWSQALWDVKGAGYDNTINDDNVAYTLHFYMSSMYHQEDLRSNSQAAIDAGLPVFVTEFGLTEESGNGVIDPNLTGPWWNFINENQLSWCNWSIANKDETSAAFIYNNSYYTNRDRVSSPLTIEELEGLTLSESANLVREELEKN